MSSSASKPAMLFCCGGALPSVGLWLREIGLGRMHELLTGDQISPHEGADLSMGYVQHGRIFCAWHPMSFDPVTGLPLAMVCPLCGSVVNLRSQMTASNGERKEILFEGFSDDEILGLPAEEIDGLVLTGQPLVFRAGSATVLGEFRRDKNRLVVELAQIEGGGEGVLLSLWSLVNRYARLQGIETVEWIVHAVTCATPNLKLRRILERRGFTVRDIPGIGQAYYYLDSSAGR